MQSFDRNVSLPSVIHSIILVIASNLKSEILVRENVFPQRLLWNIYHITFCTSSLFVLLFYFLLSLRNSYPLIRFQLQLFKIIF